MSKKRVEIVVSCTYLCYNNIIKSIMDESSGMLDVLLKDIKTSVKNRLLSLFFVIKNE